MTDPIAINSNQPTNETETLVTLNRDLSESVAKPRHIRFARFVSNILAPTTISVPMVVLIAFYKASSIANALGYAALTLFFLSIGPFLYILLGVRLGKLSDVDVSKR